MTEGIIQEVMQSWINRFAESKEEEHFLRCLEKELIDRIKQEFPIEHPFSHVYGTPRIQAKLIGDNKE